MRRRDPGELIPGDGDVIEGIASVDESAITGESAPVIRESGGDRSAVTGGTRVLSDRIVVEITTEPGETFIDRMIALVEGADRQKTPNEIALNILLAGLTIIFMLAVATLQPFAIYSNAHQPIMRAGRPARVPGPDHHRRPAVRDRHRRHGPPGAAQRAGHVRARGRGRRRRAPPCCSTRPAPSPTATGWPPSSSRSAASTSGTLAEVVLLSLLADETPEGRSIVTLAEDRYGLGPATCPAPNSCRSPPRPACRASSGTAAPIRKGAADVVRRWVEEQGGSVPADLRPIVERIAENGGTPLVVAEGHTVLGVIHLKDTVKAGIARSSPRCAPWASARS